MTLPFVISTPITDLSMKYMVVPLIKNILEFVELGDRRFARLFGRIIKLIIWKLDPYIKLYDEGGVLYLLAAPFIIPYNYLILIYNFGSGGTNGVIMLVIAILAAPIVVPLIIILELIFIFESLAEVYIFNLQYGVDFDDN